MALIDQQLDSTKFLLYAVNIMLQTINERPLEEVEDIVEVFEATTAQSVLIEVKKTVMSEGWDFNKDDDYSFPTDQSGFIIVPTNVLDISSTDNDIIMRDWRLYSKTTQSAIFDGPQKMNVIWDFDFNSLAHPLRYYITVRAARVFQARQVMDTSMYGFTESDEEDAFKIAKSSDGKTGGYNMLTSEYGTNNLVS